jgi:hypothetical protein
MECIPTNALSKLYLHFTIALRTFRSQIDHDLRAYWAPDDGQFVTETYVGLF